MKEKEVEGKERREIKTRRKEQQKDLSTHSQHTTSHSIREKHAHTHTSAHPNEKYIYATVLRLRQYEFEKFVGTIRFLLWFSIHSVFNHRRS